VGSFSGMLHDRTFIVHQAGSTHASQTIHYRGDAVRLHLN
jgi:hypothetical protein